MRTEARAAPSASPMARTAAGFSVPALGGGGEGVFWSRENCLRGSGRGRGGRIMFMGIIICELLCVPAQNSLCLAGGVQVGVCNCVSNYSFNMYYLALLSVRHCSRFL